VTHSCASQHMHEFRKFEWSESLTWRQSLDEEIAVLRRLRVHFVWLPADTAAVSRHAVYIRHESVAHIGHQLMTVQRYRTATEPPIAPATQRSSMAGPQHAAGRRPLASHAFGRTEGRRRKCNSLVTKAPQANFPLRYSLL